MRKHLFKYFRQFVAFLVVCSMLIASAPIDSYAAQDMAGDEKEKVYVADGYTVTFTLDTVWNSGYNVSVVIQNTGNETISDWYMYLKYNVDISNMWNASVYETSSSYMVLTNAGWNKDVYSNGTAGFGYTGNGDFPGFPESVKVTSGYDPTAIEGGSDDHGDDGGDTPDDGADTDGDGLTDTFEEAIGSDPELVDTDSDGLSDYQEVYLTLTDPTVKDTDGDGVLDPNEDIDEDGLGNLDELTGGTDPGNPDTDRDDLNDYDEIHVYVCDPLNYDSDGDGLCDGDDVLLGFSPTMTDTDLNGILDSAEKVYQTTENDFAFEDTHGLTSVSVSLNVSGNIDKEIEITNVYEFDAQSRDVVGLIGAPIEITCDVPFETATISFSYDESALGDTSEENLSLMWYDEENNWYQILDQDCVVDPENNTVSYTTTHFSEYNLVDRLLWFNTWNEDIDYPEEEQTEPTYHPTRYIVIEDMSSFQNTEDTELVEEIKNTLSEYSHRFKLSKEGRVLMQNGLGKTWDLTGMFDNATREYFTSDGYTITPGDEADHLWSPTYRRPNLTSILSSIVYGYDTYPEYYSAEGLVIFYISNQSSGAAEEILQACAERGIKIYTIDIRNDEEDSLLKNLSDKTNGNHYCGEITHDPVLLVNSLVYVINGINAYGSDRDKDGLLDKYETDGVRTIVGTLITTNPDDKDSDGTVLLIMKNLEWFMTSICI
ncbi:MAG: cellulose binding domain-containing protein [Lachnospiraceae bacterium]|nr:cellulose binding domain-containing protein [Lachnospiraceae bacterium]